MAGTYALTSTPQQVATGTTVQSFTNTGNGLANLTWGNGQATLIYPGAGADPRSVATFAPGGPVMASSPQGTTLVVANVVSDQGLPGMGGIAFDDLGPDVLPGLSSALSSTYARISRPPTFVTLGDSTSAVPGAGVTLPEILQAVSDRKFRMLYNAGVPGNTTAQMLARIQTDVIAKAPSYCIVLGGTNDVGGAIPLATTGANLNAIYNALLAAGIVPITATITPRNANSDVANVRDLNNWIRGNAAIRGLHCLDVNAALVDPDASFYLAGLNADTIHPNATGVVAMANAAKTLLTNLSTPQPPSLLPIEWSQTAWSGGNGYSQQFCVNPLMLDTNSDGTPDSWSLSTGGTGTITGTVVTDSRFVGRAMKWVCTSSNGWHTMQQGLNASSYAVGDKLRLYVRAAVESTSGITGSNGFIAKLYAAGANVSAYAMQQWSAMVTSGVFTVDLTVPTGTTSLSVQLDAQLGGGNGTVYWGQVGVVNLTQLGLTALP